MLEAGGMRGMFTSLKGLDGIPTPIGALAFLVPKRESDSTV